MPAYLERILEKTKGSSFGAIVRCAYDLERDAEPRFVGRATVTSDGFVMCSFVDQRGRHHNGAFVGDYAKWLRNCDGIVKLCDLTRNEEVEFQTKMYAWIGEDRQ